MAFLGRALITGIDEVGKFHTHHRVTGILVVSGLFGIAVAPLVIGWLGEVPTFIVIGLFMAGVVVNGAYLQWRALVPKGAVLIGYRVNKAWVHLLVTNKGPANSFVAQVVDVGGIPGAMTPWSILWHEWDGEQRPIASGASQLLDLAEAYGGAEGDRQTGDTVLRLRYRLDTQAAHFYSSPIDAKRRLKDQKIDSWDELPLVGDAADFLRRVALLVDVRALDPHYSAQAWVHLGFSPDGMPIVEVELVQPERSDSETPAPEPERR
jgi:hypothetical protein